MNLKKNSFSVLCTEILDDDFRIIHLDRNLVEVLANIRQYTRSARQTPAPTKLDHLSPRKQQSLPQNSNQLRCNMFPSGLSWQKCYCVNSGKWDCMLPAQRLKQ